MITKLTKLLAPAVLAVVCASTASAQSEVPPAASVKIKNGSVQVIGSGCNKNNTSVNLSADQKAFTLSFSELFAAIGPGAALTDFRKNCAVTFTIEVPRGWQYSIAQFNYRGFIDLDPKTYAEHSTNYFFQGQGTTGKWSAVEEGGRLGLEKDFVYTDKFALVSTNVWSPCNLERALTANTSIRVGKRAGAASDASAFIANDTIDGEIKTILAQSFSLSWQKCNVAGATH